MAQPSAADVRPVDPVLTNLSRGYKNPMFHWDKIAPVKEVAEQSGTFFVYTKDFWFRRQTGAERSPEGPYLRVGYGVSTDTYRTIERGYEKALGDVTSKMSQTPEALETTDVQFLANLMQLHLEKTVAGDVWATGKWGTDRTLTATEQWSDYANSDPIADVELAKRTARRLTGQVSYRMFVGALTWETLKEHPLLLDKYKHTQRGVLTEELVAAALGVTQLQVMASVENTAAEGATFAGADIWADNALIVAYNPAGLFVPAGASTIVWDEKGNVPWAVDNYYEDQTRSVINRIFTHHVTKIIATDIGYFIADTNA